ncbi:hypothetical protein GW923_00135 [Candidatus Pacearchaeota archaeon]|nr:hypothetical protein [Candidatus Pacearchaeota archaeon]
MNGHPDYVERWLEWKPRGLVIIPACDYNKDFKHPQVLKYDRSNLEEAREAIKETMRP